MQWTLFATLAEAAGDSEVPVEVEGADEDEDEGEGEGEGDGPATVGDALEALLADRPALETEVLDEDGDLRDHLRLLHEGRDPFAEADGLDTPVEADDELALFPPVSGG